LHPYIYAGNDPVLSTDPSGETWYLSHDEARMLSANMQDYANSFTNPSIAWGVGSFIGSVWAGSLVDEHVGVWRLLGRNVGKGSVALTAASFFTSEPVTLDRSLTKQGLRNEHGARVITREVLDQVLQALRAAEATEKRKAQATADDRGDTGGKPDSADGTTAGADETTGTDNTRTDEQPSEDWEIPF
jgi:hypothetical protein